ncbi:hypothetical protein BSL78_09738 [Apostichopus japonicus]|uniref:C-type lectin domain-containing protein n=1 Tax=Stichopus japonicus TaxID=307972 RepID=A0A2G8KZD2_STIJA|nr:hypothetical protein BSL78_09738 [Apostichopus japonicus]
MRPEKLAIVLLTVIVMAEGVKTSNIGYPCSPPSIPSKVQTDSNTDVSPSITEDAETTPRLTPINGDTPPSSSQEAQSDSTTDVPPSTSETIENAPRLTPINGDTPPSSSQEAQSDSTTDVPPSTSETIENAPRCNSLIVAVKNYDMAKNACGEIGGKMFGYEHVQSNKTAEETFSNLMSSHVSSSSCNYVWVDIIRKDDNQFEWSDGPNFGLQDSWWGKNQPENSEECVAGQRYDDWKLHDVYCTRVRCTMCMDALCNSV